MPTVGLVLPTASYRGPDFVAAADELGVEFLVLTDGSLALPGGRIRDVEVVDLADVDSAASVLVERATEHPLDAVIGVDDGGVMVASIAASRLGLPHNDPAAVAATRDKSVMRQRLAEAGVPQPRFRIVTEYAATAADEVGYPLVVKPVSLSGSRGVVRVDDGQALKGVVARVQAIQVEAGCGDDDLLIEEFLSGPEVAVEGLLGPDGLEILAVFDKPDPLEGPFFEETIYVTPSRHSDQDIEAVAAVVDAAARALGLEFGPIHAEVRLTAEGPKMVEVAARSIGGLCGRSLRFGMLDQSLETLLLRAALGMNRRGMGPVAGASGAMMIPIPRGGVLRAVRHREALAEVDGIEEITITIPTGRVVRPLPEGDRYLGFIIARGERPSDVEASLREAHSILDIDIAPD